MTPELADELIPVLLERLRPYLEREFVPAVIDGITPYIAETAAPRIVDGMLPYIRSEVVPVILEDFVDDPRVRHLIREQSLGLFWDALESMRAALARGDDLVENVIRKLFRKGPNTESIPAHLPIDRDRSHAGLLTRFVGTAVDVALIAFVVTQGLSAVVSVLNSFVDPLPSWVVALLTGTFAMLGPTYHVLCWRLFGRTLGGGVAGFGVTDQAGVHLGLWRSIARALVSLFLLPFWVLGMIGTVFDPARRSWGDHLVGSWTPYLVHLDRQGSRG
jgi:hypothetical protein